MYLYIIILIVAFIIAVNDMSEKKDILTLGNHKLFDGRIMFSCLVLYILLFVMTAFRDPSIGNDTATYLKIFDNIANTGVGGFSTRIEIGYKYYCFLLSRITYNHQILLISTAIICYGITGYYIFKYCEYHGVMVALFIPLFFKSFCSGLRQELAFCLCVVAYILIKKGNNYLGGVFIVLAALFHVTALVAFFYFIIPIVTSKRKFIVPFIIFLISLALFIKFSGIMEFFTRYGSYYERYYDETGKAKIGVMSCLLTLIQNVFAVYSYLYAKKESGEAVISEKSDEILWFGIMMIGISIMNFSVNNSARIMWYFELPFFVTMINMTKKTTVATRQRILIPLVLLYFASMIVGMIFRPYYYAIFPYKFWTY